MPKKSKPIKYVIEDNVLTDYVLPEPLATTPPTEQSLPTIPVPVEGAPFGVERRKGERRQNDDRREGLRGHWEERRMFDRRSREYSIFGKRLDGADDHNEANPLALAEVPLSEIISPAELRIFAEQEEEERQEEQADKQLAQQNAANSPTSAETMALIEMTEASKSTKITEAKTSKPRRKKTSGDTLVDTAAEVDSSQATSS